MQRETLGEILCVSGGEFWTQGKLLRKSLVNVVVVVAQ